MKSLALFVFAGWNDSRGRLSLATQLRCDAAFSYWKALGESVNIYVSGGTGAHFNISADGHYGHVRMYLLELGTPPNVVLHPPPLEVTQNTVQEALAWGLHLHTEVCTLVCFTNRFHVPRCRHLFNCVSAARPHVKFVFADVTDPSFQVETHEDHHYTCNGVQFPMGGWSKRDAAAMHTREVESLSLLRSTPYGVWKDWIDTNLVGVEGRLCWPLQPLTPRAEMKLPTQNAVRRDRGGTS